MALIVEDAEMWKQCCGKLPFNPSVGSMVYYFPQGHYEHMSGSGVLRSSHIDYETPILCEIRSISYLADQDSEEMFANIVLRRVDEDREIPDSPPFQLSQDLHEGFYGKKISNTHITRSLHVPRGSLSFFKAPGDMSDHITLIDVSNHSWVVKFMPASSKSGFSISGTWKDMCQAKGIEAGDLVYFKKLEVGTSFTFRRRQNFVANRYSRVDEKANEKVVRCLDAALARSRFRVTFIPNWIDFLVDPSYVDVCNETLRLTDMRVKKRNAELMGILTEPVRSNELRWKSIKVRWDSEGSAVPVNVWDVVPAEYVPADYVPAEFEDSEGTSSD